MAEPISTSSGAAAAAVAGIGVVSLLPGVDAPTAVGAFAGACVFALSAKDLSVLKRLSFLVLSIIAGILAAPFTASLMAKLLVDVAVSECVGALVASCLAVTVLLKLISVTDQGGQLLDHIRGAKRGGNEP